MPDEIFHEDINRFLTINRLVQQAEAAGTKLTRKNGSAYTYIEPLIIAPKKPLGSALDFGNARGNEMMALGRQRAREVLELDAEVI